MPPSYILFFLKKKSKPKRNMLPSYIYIVNLPFFFWIFFLNKIYDAGILEKKKRVKIVELQQFESLGGGGGVKCHV
jgi:hypothetical protein